MKLDCVHARATKSTNAVECILGVFYLPSIEICLEVCKKRTSGQTVEIVELSAEKKAVLDGRKNGFWSGVSSLPPEFQDTTGEKSVDTSRVQSRLAVCRSCPDWDGTKCKFYPKCVAGFVRYATKSFSVCLGAARGGPQRWPQLTEEQLRAAP